MVRGSHPSGYRVDFRATARPHARTPATPRSRAASRSKLAATATHRAARAHARSPCHPRPVRRTPTTTATQRPRHATPRDATHTAPSHPTQVAWRNRETPRMPSASTLRTANTAETWKNSPRKPSRAFLKSRARPPPPLRPLPLPFKSEPPPRLLPPPTNTTTPPHLPLITPT
ncbi:hypothetical protein DAI22_01g247900 [Oryza sativa Japonica Group]|nr:hypothetical protein DAI22_01g247900 [Oryza sativa Japonica Group]